MLRGLLGLATFLVLTEASSYCALWIIDGRGFDAARFLEQRRALPRAGAPSHESVASPPLATVAHPFVGFVFDARVDRRPGWSEQHRDQTVNEHGFLDTGSLIQQRGPDHVLVGVAGGTVAWWCSVDGGAALAARLRESERFADREVRIVRLAAEGYRQPQQLMALNYLLALGGELDVLVNIDGGDELAPSTSAGLERDAIAFQPRDWERLTAGEPDAGTDAPPSPRARLDLQRREWADAFSYPLAAHSPTLQLLWALRDRMLERALARAPAEPTAGASIAAAPPRGENRPRGTDATAAIAALWQRCSLQMHRICASNGIDYFHFLEPRALADAGSTHASAAVESLRAAGVDIHDLGELTAGLDEPQRADIEARPPSRRGSEILGDRVGQHIASRLGGALGFSGFVDVPPTMTLVDPAQSVELEIHGRFRDGRRRRLGPSAPGLSFRSSDPAIIAVSPEGRVTALALGVAVVAIAKDGFEARIEVVGEWDPVLEYGPERSGSVPAPRLHADGREPRLGDRGFHLVVSGMPHDGRGALVISNWPIRDPSARIPESPSLLCLPIPRANGSTDDAVVPLPIPADDALAGRPTYCQALIAGEREERGQVWTWTNGLVLTAR